MAGGRGTRLDADVEKPLFPIDGRPMVDRVCEALAASRVNELHVAVSPHTPETSRHLAARDVSRIETSGEGYVDDLTAALEALDPPVLTVAADLPLMPAAGVDRTLDAADGGAVATYVPAALKRLLGASTDSTYDHDGRTLAPVGLNVVAGTGTDTAGADESVRITYDARLAVNVNRRADAEIAEALL